MEPQQPTEPFGLQLNKAGIVWAIRFARLTGVITFIWLLLLLCRIFANYIHIRLFDDYETHSFLEWMRKTGPYFNLALMPIAFAQMWHYWQVGRKLKQSIRYSDETLFNDAFRALYLNAVYGIILLVLEMILDIIYAISVARVYFTN